uniref:Uncharacterized protein n=1 Tax=Arundo donax TaxID=35708 RepID=A0A0A8Y943_ARUDO
MHSRCGLHTAVRLPALMRRRCADDLFCDNASPTSRRPLLLLGRPPVLPSSQLAADDAVLTTWSPCELLLVVLFFFFSGGIDAAGMRKYISPRSSSESGDTMRILRTTPCEHGLLSTWFGLAARISPAATGRPYSSTRPFRWTIRIRSSAPQGRTQARQHLRLLPIAVYKMCLSLA